MRRFVLAGTFMAAALFLGTSSAQAALICNNCTFLGNPGTYIGVLNPTTNDQATFDHTSVPTGTVIDDMWVFDIAPAGNGSASANFTIAAPFTGFTGGIYNVGAGATTCPALAVSPNSPSGTLCTAVSLGGLLAGDSSADPQVVSTNLVGLAAGRYIFRLQGTAGAPFGTYTGQVATNNVVVPEPAMLSLLGLGLAAAARRRRKA
jgi:hypothetical protein